MELSGKVVIVTGAAGFIGAGCCREIAAQGASLVVSDLPGTPVDVLVDEIRAAGGQAIAHRGDISQEADVIALVDTARQAFGGVDALVNVAAAMDLISGDRLLADMTVELWDRMMAVNLRGAMLCCKYAIDSMIERGGGSIVTFSSTAGLRGDLGMIAYSTSKAALLGFARSIATAYGKQGVRCNALCPGSVWNEGIKAGMGAEALDLALRTRMTPRLGEPEDIAHMVVYLCSDKSRYLTGQTIVIDGGGTQHQPWAHMR